MLFRSYFSKKKTILPPENKKSCVIEEVKTKFFATTVNWYKTQLTVDDAQKISRLNAPGFNELVVVRKA